MLDIKLSPLSNNSNITSSRISDFSSLLIFPLLNISFFSNERRLLSSHSANIIIAVISILSKGDQLLLLLCSPMNFLASSTQFLFSTTIYPPDFFSIQNGLIIRCTIHKPRPYLFQFVDQEPFLLIFRCATQVIIICDKNLDISGGCQFFNLFNKFIIWFIQSMVHSPYLGFIKVLVHIISLGFIRKFCLGFILVAVHNSYCISINKNGLKQFVGFHSIFFWFTILRWSASENWFILFVWISCGLWFTFLIWVRLRIGSHFTSEFHINSGSQSFSWFQTITGSQLMTGFHTNIRIT